LTKRAVLIATSCLALTLLASAFTACVTTEGKAILFYEQERTVQSMRRLDLIEGGCQLIKTREAEEGPVARAMFRNYAVEIGANVVSANAAGHDVYAAKFYACPDKLVRELRLFPLCLERPDALACQQLRE